GHGDNRTVDSFAEMRFGPVLELPQDEGRNLGRGEELVAQTNPNDIPARGINAEREKAQLVLNVANPAAHQALDRVNAAIWLREQATARRLADDNAAVLIHADHRRTQRAAAWADDANRFARLRIGISHQAIGRAQIDSDNASHD